ncbi:lipase [Oleiphilus messinensis]|uniref:Lipase n=1 Tax=Oleiphilus messinensis TaxID=141451 RepID=A0A1Y0IBU6_9GAMM|nr:alpha/beta fold hydrolase [Oleiphilus messinensis]ARU56935.1 lipase [Oleiphilus messinensis]
MFRSIICGVALILLLGIGLVSCATKTTALQSTAYIESECVVLVHGLWRSGAAMQPIAEVLNQSGYNVVVIDYPSTRLAIPSLARTYIHEGVQECADSHPTKIHLVSHSMGAILIRQYLQDHMLPSGSKVVMLSPPNQGSELSERFAGRWWFDGVVGPAASSLTQHGIISRLAPLTVPVGIIAAKRNWSLWPDALLPEPNDGTVSLSSMALPEMNDWIEIESGHAMMRFNSAVQAQILHFLQHSHFLHTGT